MTQLRLIEPLETPEVSESTWPEYVKAQGMVSECAECVIAERNPHHGVYMTGCRGCQVRHISHMPWPMRDIAYKAAHATERDALKQAVAAEFKRREGR